MPNLELFRNKVREYRILAHHNQADLALYLGIDYTELSNRLNAYKRTRLTHENVRAIVRALAEWKAITTQSQAIELLDLMAAPYFDQVDWQAFPLDRLKPGLSQEKYQPSKEKIAPPISDNRASEKWVELNYEPLQVFRVELAPEAVHRQIGIVNPSLIDVIQRIDSSKTNESADDLRDFFTGAYKEDGWLDISAIAHLISGFRNIVVDLEKAGGFSIVFRRHFLVSAVTVTPAILAWNYFPHLEPDESLINIVQIDLVHKFRPRR